jgi:hypothetical protein
MASLRPSAGPGSFQQIFNSKPTECAPGRPADGKPAPAAVANGESGDIGTTTRESSVGEAKRRKQIMAAAGFELRRAYNTACAAERNRKVA